MFAKMKVKPTLAETYEEAERVEAESESVEDYPDSLEDKTVAKRVSLLSKPRKDQSHDYQGMMKMLQKLSNRIIDLEGKGTFRNPINLTIRKEKTMTNGKSLLPIRHQ